MLKLRTKIVKTVAFGRATKEVIIRFIIDKIEIDKNNISAKGYYYYLDENNSIVILSQLGTLTKTGKRLVWLLNKQAYAAIAEIMLQRILD